MCARWPRSLCSLLLWTCLTACSGSVSGDGRTRDASVADGGGGDAAAEPDAGDVYQGEDGGVPGEDAGAADAAQGGTGGSRDGGAGGTGGSGGGGSNELEDVEPAECRPDPSDFTACGGDVTGEWRVSSICLDADTEDLRERLMCSELTQDFTFEYRMLVDFNRSGNYTAAVHAAAVQTVLLPYSCVPEDAEGDCRAALGDDDTDDSDGRTVLVTMNDDGCVIEAYEQRSISEAGTWKVSGDEITMTNAIGPRTSEYCVDGDSLIVKNVNTATNEVSWGVFERL
jgi:hypothetical protein